MQSKGYWLGKSMQLLPASTVKRLDINTHFSEFGTDISILTREDVHIAHFFYSENFKHLFELSMKICVNLNKQLIVLCDNNALLSQFPPNTNITYINILSNDNKNPRINDVIIDVKYKHINSSILDVRMKKIDDYISVNINRDIREEEVAQISNLSINYFSRFFRKHRKVSFQDYITQKRVTIAQQLLVNSPAEKVSSIAYQAGYSDVSYFNRVFKKQTMMTPTQYRKMSLSNNLLC